MKKGGLFREIFGWLAAIVLAFFAVNLLIFFYYNRPAWISLQQGATTGVYHPNRNIVYAYEGFGINMTDENGYVNPQKELADNYVLVMGASHTQGKEVMMRHKYTSLLNERFGGSDKLQVYNMAVDGNYYPSIVSRFAIALEKFPDYAAVVIELGNTDYTKEELSDSLETPEFERKVIEEGVMEQLSAMQKVSVIAKEAMPLSILLSYKQLAGLDFGFDSAFWYHSPGGEQSMKQDSYKLPEEENILEKTLQKLRTICDKPIIIVYHPGVQLEEDGSMRILRDGGAGTFSRLCRKNDICFLDMGEQFLEAYEKERILPYGFSNSSPGSGHLNRNGHAMLAETLYQKLQETGVEVIREGDGVK